MLENVSKPKESWSTTEPEAPFELIQDHKDYLDQDKITKNQFTTALE
jgi:hypothetical protein